MVGRGRREWAHTAVHAAAREFVLYPCIDTDTLTIVLPASHKCHVLQNAKLSNYLFFLMYYALNYFPEGAYGRK